MLHLTLVRIPRQGSHGSGTIPVSIPKRSRSRFRDEAGHRGVDRRGVAWTCAFQIRGPPPLIRILAAWDKPRTPCCRVRATRSISDQNGTVEKVEKGETLFFRRHIFMILRAKKSSSKRGKTAKVPLNATLMLIERLCHWQAGAAERASSGTREPAGFHQAF